MTAALASVVLAGCTGGAPDGRNQVRPVTWHSVHLPEGLQPVTVTRLGDRLLVGAATLRASSVPRLLLGSGDSWRMVPLTPKSYYAQRARWKAVITDGHRIYAVGQASGGAHGGRATLWAGRVTSP